jgi:hypothetical protein
VQVPAVDRTLAEVFDHEELHVLQDADMRQARATGEPPLDLAQRLVADRLAGAGSAIASAEAA